MKIKDAFFVALAITTIVVGIILVYHGALSRVPDVGAAPLRVYAQGPSTSLISTAGGVISTNVVATLTADGKFLWLICGNDGGDKALVKLNGYVSLTEKDFIVYNARSAYPTCGGDGAIEIDYVTILVQSDIVTPTEVTTDVWCVAW